MIIRQLKSDEYRALEELQRSVWGMPEIEILPGDFMATVAKTGGVLLGAFDPQLVGFVFGFLSRSPSGEISHWSHIAGVAQDARDRDIGYQLKLAQRQVILAQGIDLIRWTYDPLESRNARFNLHKLGATCNEYRRNEYGELRDTLNAGLPSDRFVADWRISSERVERCVGNEQVKIAASALIASGVPLVSSAEAVERAAESSDRLLFEIPGNFQRVKAEDAGEALRWRLASRGVFESAFARDFIASDLLLEEGRSFYLLKRNPVD